MKTPGRLWNVTPESGRGSTFLPPARSDEMLLKPPYADGAGRIFLSGHRCHRGCRAAVAAFISTHIDEKAARDSGQEAQNAH